MLPLEWHAPSQQQRERLSPQESQERERPPPQESQLPSQQQSQPDGFSPQALQPKRLSPQAGQAAGCVRAMLAKMTEVRGGKQGKKETAEVTKPSAKASNGKGKAAKVKKPSAKVKKPSAKATNGKVKAAKVKTPSATGKVKPRSIHVEASIKSVLARTGLATFPRSKAFPYKNQAGLNKAKKDAKKWLDTMKA